MSKWQHLVILKKTKEANRDRRIDQKRYDGQRKLETQPRIKPDSATEGASRTLRTLARPEDIKTPAKAGEFKPLVQFR
jgi:hypothetical protein